MSRIDSKTSRRRTVVGVGLGTGAAFAAALIGLGTAGAANADVLGDAAAAVTGTGTFDNPVVDTYPDPDGYVDLFGAQGAQGVADEAASTALFQSNAGNAAAFDTLVDSFESNNTHPLVDLVHAIDPAAFYYQIDPDILGGTTPYLVPDDFLGYLAQGLDFGLLNPTGLGYVLDPIIEVLLGQPPV